MDLIILQYFDVVLQATTDLVTSCDCCPGHVDQHFETQFQLMLSFDATDDAQSPDWESKKSFTSFAQPQV